MIGRDNKRPNTNMDRHRQDKTKVYVQHQPYSQAFKNASINVAVSIKSRACIYGIVYISLSKVDL